MNLQKALLILFLIINLEIANAVQFEALGTAVAKALGTTKAFKSTARTSDNAAVFYAKNAAGHASKLVIVQKGVYEPNCTHTWVVALNPETAKVDEVRVVEMSCPHAFPAQKASYLEQYKGKGPANLKSLKSEIITIAKATGSCQLTTDAVVKSIRTAALLRGKL